MFAPWCNLIMPEDDKEVVLELLDDALSEVREELFAHGQLDRLEDLENTLWHGELHSALMNLTTLLFEAELTLPTGVYEWIAEAGQKLNENSDQNSQHRKWTWERLMPQCKPKKAA